MKTFNQKNNTRAFVAELEIRNQLEAVGFEPEEMKPSESDEKQRRMAAEMVAPFDWHLQTGEIRLLSQTDRLTYGVILPWDWNHLLLIPLSHASHPATDQEMYVSDGERGMFQQVYQLWNARTVNKSVLAKSWEMGKITEEDLSCLNQFLRHIWLGDKLSQSIIDRTGLPLLQGNDIRKPYLDRELSNFIPLDKIDEEAEWAEHELKSPSVILRFEELSMEAGLQAAAGKNMLSESYLLTRKGLKILQGVELIDFEKTPAGSVLPHFHWIAKTVRGIDLEILQVLFRHSKTGDILGSGPILKQPDGYEIILENSIEPEDVPELNKPSDIQLIFCK